MKPIVVVGSINVDVVAVCERIPVPGETVSGSAVRLFPGGKGANQAVAVARLGYPVRLIGRLGSDVLGEQLRSALEREGIDLAGVTVSEGPTGVAVIVVSEKGDNSIVVVQGANAHLTPEFIELHRDIIESAGVVLTQLEIPAESVEFLANLCERIGVPLILDPAPARALSQDVLSKVRWFTPNESEAAFFDQGITEDAVKREPALVADDLIKRGAAGVVLKKGATGVFLATNGGLRASIPAFAVRAVDSTAAGDVFNGAFATGLMLGKGPVESARFAAAASAISVTREGAQPSMPLMKEVEEMMSLGKIPEGYGLRHESLELGSALVGQTTRSRT